MNDAERLRDDPATPWVVHGGAAHSRAASPSQMGRFEARRLTAEKNLAAFADFSGRWIDRVHASARSYAWSGRNTHRRHRQPGAIPRTLPESAAPRLKA